MVKKVLHSVLSVFLGLLLVFGSTSKEYIHLFADHEDTVHCHQHYDGLTIEQEHHHCTFLSFTLTSFINDAGQYHIEFRPHHDLILQKAQVDHLIPRAVPASRLRGPPVVV